MISKLTTKFAAWAKDAVVRAWNAGWTAFVGQMAGASIIGVDGVVDTSLVKRAVVAACAAGGMTLWALVAKFFGDPGSARLR